MISIDFIFLRDWLTGSEPKPIFWKMMYPELELAARFDFLEWYSIMGMSPIGDRAKSEWTIISSEASEDCIFI